MTNLYRLVKAGGFCFQGFGSIGGIRTNEAEMLSEIEGRLPPGWRRQPSSAVDRLYSFFFNSKDKNQRVKRFHVLYRNDQVLARSKKAEELLEEFERQVNGHIFQTCRNKCFVHAGVVGWNGKAIVIPGHSYSGKTTLVREFLKRGASYYSDEFAVLDRRGYVHAFAKPLGVREPTNDKQRPCPATSIPSCKIGAQPIPVALILFTQYKASVCWRPREISVGECVLKLLSHSLSARTNPSGALTCLGKAAAEAKALCSLRGEAHEVVRRLLEDQGPVDENYSQEKFLMEKADMK